MSVHHHERKTAMPEQIVPESVDVVIVGMGPVGKFAAIKLARAGHSVLIVDKKEADYALPRAVAHDSEIARILQGAGFVVDDMPEAVEPYDDLYVWVNADDEALQEIDMRGIGESGWNNTYFYHQPALEARFEDAIGDLDGVFALRGHAAAVTGQDAGSVSVTLTPAEGGDARALSARYVLGADGANSSTRRDAGISWHDLGFKFDWLVVDVVPGPEVEITHLAKQICDPARPTTVVPGGPGRRRWEFMLLDGEDPVEIARPERIWELLEPFGVTAENSVVERGVVYTFTAGWAESWRSGRVFLLGDAAHLMPPFAGQGLAAGFRDAANLTWKLDLALRGLASDELLDTYESERLNHVREFIDFSIALGRVICITDPEIAAGRDAQMLAAIRENAVPAPPPAPRLGVGVHQGDHGGVLARQGRIVTKAATDPARFDDVFGTGALIVRGDRSAVDDAVVEQLAAVGIAVASFDPPRGPGAFDDVDGVYGRWLDELGIAAVLVRPDLTVYGTAAAVADVGALAGQYLQAVTGATYAAASSA